MITATKAIDLSRVQHTATDVRFMQGMIGHHAQALDMTALVPTRSSREDMQMFALRIKLSQEDEIKMMEDWLEVRGEEIPGVRDHHESGGTLMPGMLTAKEINRSGVDPLSMQRKAVVSGLLRSNCGSEVLQPIN